ncbi:MAG: hypothetical protein ACM3L5_00250 [Candidatus Saccharibacteria bacterium]
MTATAGAVRNQCLWHAADGRCSNCKARRIRNDVLKLKDYEMCEKGKDYEGCEFFVEKPNVTKK